MGDIHKVDAHKESGGNFTTGEVDLDLYRSKLGKVPQLILDRLADMTPGDHDSVTNDGRHNIDDKTKKP